MTVAYPHKLRNNLSARDILQRVVREREIHLITLNRYRYNEQRSCKDLTELIEQLNGNPPEMIRDLSHHVNDESRHAMWLTDLLIDIGGPIDNPPGVSYIDEFERLIDRENYPKPEDALIAALAAINVTEKRGCEYFAAHIHALKAAPQTEENIKIRQTIEKIFPEETAHVRWGNQQLAKIAAQSPAHRQKVEATKRKYIAIEQAAYESGMDIMFGAEMRRVNNLMGVVNTLPLWERPQYLMTRLPETILDPELQKIRISAAQKAWNKDPEAFVTQFIPMFLGNKSVK
jgi:hypothetical protein